MPRRPVVPEDLKLFWSISDPQVSPDGKSVAFTAARPDDRNKTLPNVWLVEAATKKTRRLTQGEGGSGQPRWFPDGSKLAFVSGREKAGSQIFVLPMDGGEGQRLTNLEEGSVRSMSVSPDGTHIAFDYRPTSPDRTMAAAKQREESGLSSPPWEIDSLWYRLDGDGFFGQQRYTLHVVEVKTGESKRLFAPKDVDFFDFSWLPDSSGLVVCAPSEKGSLLKKANDQVYVVSLAGKATMLPGLPKGSKSMPRVAPNGKSIAWIGVVDDDVWGTKNNRLFVAPVKGGSWKCLTQNDDICLAALSLTDSGSGGGAALHWTPDSRSLRVMVGIQGTSQIGDVDARSGKLVLLTGGDHLVGPTNLDTSGKRQACVLADPLTPNEVALCEAGKLTRLTSFNKALLQGLELVKPESAWVKSTGGTKVQAWVMKPAGLKSGKKAPTVIEVHGGPHAQYGMGYFHEFQWLVALGYVVVFSNPRGSKGYGEDFCKAIAGDWGNKDWDDVKSVTAWAQSQPWCDPARIGIMGGSYGGYMTNWAVGHSLDYKAAITDRCVSNWVSMAGNSDFPLARDDYFGGHAWGDLEQISKMWQQSPLAYFDKVKTPMLVIHSEGDFRCNVEQAEQDFHSLQAQRIPSRFVRYPIDTSHGMSRNGPVDLRIHRLKEIAAWWKKHL